MSKAFTRESDDLPERPLAPRPAAVLPPGVKNYITPQGARRLQEELDRLISVKPGSPEAQAQAAALQRKLQSVEVVPAPPPPQDQVRFGASVTVRDPGGFEETFHIVGIDEADPARDRISWLSPLARGLTNARLGERVRIRLPGGERELLVVCIAYEPPSSSA